MHKLIDLRSQLEHGRRSMAMQLCSFDPHPTEPGTLALVKDSIVAGVYSMHHAAKGVGYLSLGGVPRTCGADAGAPQVLPDRVKRRSLNFKAPSA